MSGEELTLEKLEISKRLSNLEVAVTKMVERFDSHIKSEDHMFEGVNAIIKRHDKLLLGSDGGWEGLAVKVDRLNQKEKTRDWTLKTIVIAVVGLVVQAVWATITRGG